MTTLKQLYVEGVRTGFEVKGHAGGGQAGEDLLCAAVSTLVQTAYLGIKNLTQTRLKMQRRDGYFRVEIVDGTPEERQKADLIMSAMLLGISDLQKGYPNNIRLED